MSWRRPSASRKSSKYGVEESDQTHFEQYAENWLKRQQPFFKATTYAGYKRNLDIVYPLIGGIPLAKLLPMTLEEMCEELRKRPGRGWRLHQGNYCGEIS